MITIKVTTEKDSNPIIEILDEENKTLALIGAVVLPKGNNMNIKFSVKGFDDQKVTIEN